MTDDDAELLRMHRATVTTHWLTPGWPGPGIRVCAECTDSGCPRNEAGQDALKNVGVAGLYALDPTD